VGSQVSHLRKDGKKSIHWFTGTTIPCLSVFKPYVFPIEGQKVLEPGPYSKINPEWIWSKHAEYITLFKKNPKKENVERDIYYKKLREIEFDLINHVNSFLSQEGKISEGEFVNKIKLTNLEAWEKSIEIIK